MAEQNGTQLQGEHRELLEELGEEKVRKLYDSLGTKKIYLKPLIEHLNREAIKKSFQNANGKPTKQIINELKTKIGVPRSTVYRFLKIKIK